MKRKPNANQLRFIISNSRDMDKVETYMQANRDKWLSSWDVNQALKLGSIQRTRKILHKLCDKWNRVEKIIGNNPYSRNAPKVTMFRWRDK